MKLRHRNVFGCYLWADVKNTVTVSVVTHWWRVLTLTMALIRVRLVYFLAQQTYRFLPRASCHCPLYFELYTVSRRLPERVCEICIVTRGFPMNASWELLRPELTHVHCSARMYSLEVAPTLATVKLDLYPCPSNFDLDSVSVISVPDVFLKGHLVEKLLGQMDMSIRLLYLDSKSDVTHPAELMNLGRFKHSA